MTVKQPEAKQELLLLYDGHCNLCNWAVAYVYRNDKRKRIQIQSLQSYELPLPEGVNLVEGIPDSVLFYANGRWYDQSSAVLELMRALGGGTPFFSLGIWNSGAFEKCGLPLGIAKPLPVVWTAGSVLGVPPHG